MLSVVVGVMTGHYIMGMLACRINLAHLAINFCSSCRYEEEDETDSYYVYDLDDLSNIDSLSHLIGNSKWFRNYEIIKGLRKRINPYLHTYLRINIIGHYNPSVRITV